MGIKTPDTPSPLQGGLHLGLTSSEQSMEKDKLCLHSGESWQIHLNQTIEVNISNGPC